MDVTRLLIALFVGMAVLIFLIMKTRLHPSLSLVISACVVGIVGGVELASIPGLITSGFGNTLAGIGLVIAFGCMMGQIMEESNSAKVMAHTFIKALHGKNEEIALAITGFLVSIPIFADSAGQVHFSDQEKVPYRSGSGYGLRPQHHPRFRTSHARSSGRHCTVW